MLVNFCKLCHKTLDTIVFSLRRCSKKASNAVNHRSKRIRTDESLRESYLEKEEKEKAVIISCKRKEFNFYQGQTYRKHSDIPLASQSWQHPKAKGDHFFIYPTNEMSYENTTVDTEPITFESFELHPGIIKTLQNAGFKEPLPVQKSGIPKIMYGQNVLLASETGCGKTLAFLLPMIDKILKWKELGERDYNCPLGLIITPTRELAVQIGLEAARMSKNLGVRTKILTGGRTQKIYRNPPLEQVDIIIATLGVISKLTTNKIYNMDYVRHVVLDEIDAQLHETFLDKLFYFMNHIPIGVSPELDEDGFPKAAQLTLASATVPEAIISRINNIINVDFLDTVSSENIKKILVPQKFVRLGPSQKPMELLKYIKPKVSNKESVIVFSNKNSTCDWISMFLNENNVKTVHLNGAMQMMFRRGQYAKFRDGQCFVLSTTNAGSRGLDTTMAQHVLNYEFPLNTSDYIHRCGRTGRIGGIKNCRVTNFISSYFEIDLVKKIERSVRRGRPIPIIDLSKRADGIEEKEEEYGDVSAEPYVEEEVEDLEGEYRIPY